MVHLLQPIWLWAITAIAVPLFIHLWNVKKGKTLKVGSIAFISESARSHARSLRLSDRLLLLLRCLLLILLALLLAIPVFETPNTSAKEKGWILVVKNDLPQAYKNYSYRIDSLLQAGYSLRYFEKGFAIGALTDTSVNISVNNNISYWATLKQLDQQISASLPVYLFTNNSLSHFYGTRPSVSLDLHWKTYISRDTLQSSVSAPDVKSLSVCIYFDEPAMGAQYVKAALEAISAQTKRKINISLASTVSNIPAANDWLFWLSEKPLPLSAKATNILAYEKGRVIDSASSLLVANRFTILGSEEIPLLKSIATTAKEKACWTNGYGQTILGGSAKPGGYRYHFYSRFDPQWSGLVWSAQFPGILYDLLFVNDTDHFQPSLKATIDEQQLQPDINKIVVQKHFLMQQTSLSAFIWLSVFLIFLVERSLTYRRKKEGAHA